MRTGVYVALYVAVFAVAFVVRFWDLSAAPIWMDEAFAYMAAKLPLKVILLNQIDNHPPLFYALQHLWHGLDPSLSSVRTPAAIAGGLAVVVTALAAADLISLPAGLGAGAYLALCTGHLYFSQDARMYPLLSLGVAGAVWGLAGLAQRSEQSLRYGALYFAGGVIAVYAQVASLVFLGVINLAVVVLLVQRRRWRAGVIQIVAANLALALASLPWLLSLATAMNAFIGLRAFPAQSAIWFFDNMVGFPALQKPAKAIADLALFGALFYGAVRGWLARDSELALIAVCGLVAYPLALVALNMRTPILENRVFIPCELAAALLLGLAVDSLSRPVWRWSLIAAVALVSTTSAVIEHAERVKPEDDPQAFAIADHYGFRNAPVLTCNFLPAASAHLADPLRPVFLLTPELAPEGPVKMDDRMYRAVAMSLARLHRAKAADFKPYIGDDADTRFTSAKLLSSDKVIILASACEPQPLRTFLRQRGYVHLANPPLRLPTLILNALWTQPELWRRAGPLSRRQSHWALARPQPDQSAPRP